MENSNTFWRIFRIASNKEKEIVSDENYLIGEKANIIDGQV